MHGIKTITSKTTFSSDKATGVNVCEVHHN